MPDPTKHYTELVDEEMKRLRQNVTEAEKIVPTYPMNADTLSSEEVRQDFAVATMSGERPQRLKEWRAQHGLVKAAFMFADWVIENENASNI